MKPKVITRFAPSPTGFLHIGSVRTALFSYILAKQNKGEFILRIEDTDKERSKPEFEQDIVNGIDWLGFDYGSTFYRQSEREDLYKSHLKKMVDGGSAYISKEEATKDEEGRPLRAEVIRFKNPNKKIKFMDLIRGEVEFDTTELGDFVIAKSLSEPLYHLAVVIDDFEMKVTHVVRGEDHISNTPRQILIQGAIGAPRPVYAHLPLILDGNRAKMSKRKHGELVSLEYYRRQGFLKEAIINYLALLGWNPGTDQEIFTLEELIKVFDISKVQKSGAVFDTEKLRWLNKQHIERLPKAELYARIKEIIGQNIAGELLQKITPVITERIQTFGDLQIMKNQGELEYFFTDPSYQKGSLLFKGKGDFSALETHLKRAIELLKAIPEHDFNAEAAKDAVWEYASAVGRGDVLWPMRFALSGQDKSPDPFILADILGKKVTLHRLETALNLIAKHV